MIKFAPALMGLVLLAACGGKASEPAPAPAPAPAVAPAPEPAAPPAPAVTLVSPTDPQQIFSNAELTPKDEVAIKAAGFTGDLAEVKAHLNDKTGWPTALSDEETRNFNWDTVKKYKVEKLASFVFYKHDAVLVRVPAAENKHMPPEWQLPVNFYILFDAKAFAPAS
ncbi:MAG TPA: hypothetical protein VG942_10965 [Hyphomonadaceae bacterium]|nr:hypothetical protein [Hyphomonadaceae bacterium]